MVTSDNTTKQTFENDYPMFYVQEETMITSKRCISFRGLSKKRVEQNCDAFIRSLPLNSLIHRGKINRFISKQYCVLIWFQL